MKIAIEAELDSDDVLGKVERAAIVRALEAAGGNVTDAAELLGIYRQSLQRKMRKHGIAASAEFRLWHATAGELGR